MEQTETEKYSQKVLQDYYDDYVEFRNQIKKQGFLSYQEDGKWIVRFFDNALLQANEYILELDTKPDEERTKQLMAKLGMLHAFCMNADHPMEWHEEKKSFVFIPPKI